MAALLCSTDDDHLLGFTCVPCIIRACKHASEIAELTFFSQAAVLLSPAARGTAVQGQACSAAMTRAMLAPLLFYGRYACIHSQIRTNGYVAGGEYPARCRGSHVNRPRVSAWSPRVRVRAWSCLVSDRVPVRLLWRWHTHTHTHHL